MRVRGQGDVATKEGAEVGKWVPIIKKGACVHVRGRSRSTEQSASERNLEGQQSLRNMMQRSQLEEGRVMPKKVQSRCHVSEHVLRPILLMGSTKICRMRTVTQLKSGS
jgi:hypothetical protein